MELAFGVWVRNTILLTLMIWASNIIDDILVLELDKESFVCASCTPLPSVDSFMPIGLGSLCTPLLGIGGVVAIVLVSIPTIGLD
jgi:hypothetical protein